MKISCIAVDDEPLALRQMVDFIKKTPFLICVAECTSAFDAMEVLEKHKIDVMFLDINMPGLNGMEFTKALENRPEVIFTTAYSEYALEGFKVNAIDYLLKPIGYADFLKAANKVRRYFEIHENGTKDDRPENSFLFVKSEYRMIRIEFEKIKYIEGMREYVRIHLTTGERIMTLMSMKSLNEKLPSESFMRVHKSYIVSLNRIETIERSRIIFDKDVYIPIGDQYREAFQSFLDQHFL